MRKKVFISEEIINADLLNEKKRIFILSTNINAKRILFILLQNKVRVSGFAVKKSETKQKLYGLKVFTLDEIDEKDSAYVVEREQWDFFCEIVDEETVYYVDSQYCNKNEFIFKENGEIKKCNAALMLTMILSRVQKRRAVFLIKSEDYIFWKNLIDVLQDEIHDAAMIAIETESDKIYDLMYYEPEKLLVFICVFDYKNIFELLTDLGLKQTYHFVFIYNSFSGNVTDKYYGFDWLLGNTFIQKQGAPGFYIHGDRENTSKKIVLLGNSATDPLFYPQKSWPEMLWENYKKHQINLTIYNGAITDYSSANEVMKLIRDVLLIKPDIVVSYSGIIDFRQYMPCYPYVNLNLMRTSQRWEGDNKKEVIYGIEDNRSAYERWLENEKIMHQICQMNDISFFGILQPWLGSERANAWEKLQVWSDYYWEVEFPQFDSYINNAKEFKKRILEDVKKNDWLYDFTNIFSEIDDSDIYFDSIHVNERGNMIVAEKINEILPKGIFEAKMA